MFFISFDKLIEILSPLILIVCIIAIIELNKDYDAEREQEKRQALEDYQIASDYIDPAEILKRYFSQNDLHFVNQDDFTSMTKIKTLTFMKGKTPIIQEMSVLR